MKRTLSVRGIAVKNNRLLCVKLKEYHPDMKIDFWCLPGGGVDEGEAILPALEREFIEELGVKPKIGRLLFVHQLTMYGKDGLEFFFEILNPDDYQNIDLSQTTHGQKEIDEIGFINPKEHKVLPEFLQKIDLNFAPDFQTEFFNYK